MSDQDDKTKKALIKAEAFTIETAEQFLAADQFCASLKELEREIDAGYDEQIAQAHELHKSLIAKKKAYQTPVEAARRILKDKMAAWTFKKNQEREALERQLQEQVRKKQEDDALHAAYEAEKAGDKVAAEAILAQPIVAPPIVLPPMTPKTQTKFQTRWTFRITNANAIPRQFLKPDEVLLQRYATAMKGAANVPGVEFFAKTV